MNGFSMDCPTPIYPPVVSLLLPGVLLDAILHRRRSFRTDALSLAARITPPLRIEGQESIPSQGPALLLCNHYYRSGFEATWIAFAISAAVPVEVAWVMTAERRYEHIRLGALRRMVERLGLRVIARAYGFFSMPAMPPRPEEAGQRASVVRQIIARARSVPPPIIGLSPEGRDMLDGKLGEPPPGAGRLIAHLAKMGCALHPVGLFEAEGRLCVNFGAPFTLDLPEIALPERIDRDASTQTMQAIARLLPTPLRGEY